jgi:phosphate transport system substrate-binding protein
MGKRKLGSSLLLIALLLAVAGCASSSAGLTRASGSTLQGTVTISGAWALYPLMVRWAEEFQTQHPDVRFDISAGGAGKGMADALAGAVDMGMISRAIYPEEVDKGAFWVSVTKDAVFPTVSEQNPVWADLYRLGLDRDALIGIFVSGEITTWGQAVGRPEVSEAIHVFTRSDACGAAATWAEFLGMAQEDLLGVAVYGDPGLLDAIIKDPLGIGFNNLNYAYDMDSGAPVPGARVVPVDADGNGRADAGEVYDTKDQAVEGVAMGLYPSPPARDLNVVTPGKPSGLTAAFIRWILTDGQAFVDEAGYIALPASQLSTELEKLD